MSRLMGSNNPREQCGVKMYLLTFLACFVCASYAVPLEEVAKVQSFNSEDVATRGSFGNTYLLFTRANPTTWQPLFVNNAESVRSSNFNPNVPTVVIAHGWMGNRNTELNHVIRTAFLERFDCNVVVLDWSQVALGSYLLALYNLPRVGLDLGQFLAFLSDVSGTRLELVHLVGFSLGSHLVGYGGRAVNGRVGRITGLDPMSPAWENNENRLNRNDGIYVEIIHTNGMGTGVNTASGHADFYPNGGNSQPGCITNVCNHNRSWQLFAATVSYNHLIGRECSNEQEVSSNTCTGKSFNMGNGDIFKRGSGLYRLTTGSAYPY